MNTQEFLDILFFSLREDESIHLRSFSKQERKVTQSWSHSVAATLLVLQEVPQPSDVYFGTCARKPREADKRGVTRIRSLWADIDYKHFNSNQQAHAVLDGFELKPTLVVNSGGGLQAYWVFEESLPATASNVAYVESLMLRLYHRLGGLDKVQDVSRIMRVPGFYNQKYEEAPAVVIEEAMQNPEARYTLLDFEGVLPQLPVLALPNEVQVDRTYAPPTEAEVAAMLTVLPKDGWDYRDYMAILMAVHSVFPDERGIRLIQEWSPALDSQGEDITAAKWASFRSGGISMGTLYKFALDHGWEPAGRGPKMTLVRDGLPTPHRPQSMQPRPWESLLEGYPAVTREELPYYLGKVYDYIIPVTKNFVSDWTEMLALTFWSTQWNRVHFENLPLNLWFLGLGPTSVGKSLGQQELQKCIRRMNEYRESDAAMFTSGTTRGMLNRLQGEGKQVNAVFDEFVGFLKSANTEHTSGIKEVLCSLYDGTGFTHQKAEETLEADSPYVTLSGLTTPEAFRENAKREDMLNGFMARILFCAPDVDQVSPRVYFEEESRAAFVNMLVAHIQEYAGVTKAKFDTMFGSDPESFRNYSRSLGIDTGRRRNLDDEIGQELDIPWGRVIARIKKVAALLELAEEKPNVIGDTVYVHERNVALAIRICQRGAAYQKRALDWLESTRDEGDVLKTATVLAKKGKLTEREIMQYAHLTKQRANSALSLLVNDGRVTVDTQPKKTVFVWNG